ncbi:unnamed protein product, partial [Meganyctiphanes norvegica]
GSCKIGSYCSSTIEVLATDGLIEVKFYEDHSGHTLDLEDFKHTPLPLSTKKIVAERLSQSVPTKVILEEVRSLGVLSRSTYITYKDISNVKNHFMKSNNEEIEPPVVQSSDNELEDIIQEIAIENSPETDSQLKKDKLITTMNEIITLLNSQNYPISHIDAIQKQQNRVKATLKAALIQIPISSKPSTNSTPGKKKIMETKISFDKSKKIKQNPCHENMGWD